MRPQTRSRMIYTPKQQIPIGEAIMRPDGGYAILIKYKDRIEEISMDTLYSSVILNANREMSADREPPQRRHPSPPTSSSI